MKTHVLLLSPTFQRSHPRAGDPTNFKAQLLAGQKKHTLRENYEYWEPRIREVQEGNAILSVREWTGAPYRSKQSLICELGAASGLGIDCFRKTEFGGLTKTFGLSHSEKLTDRETFAQNDGFASEDFTAWFQHVKAYKPMALIYFSWFRY